MNKKNENERIKSDIHQQTVYLAKYWLTTKTMLDKRKDADRKQKLIWCI